MSKKIAVLPGDGIGIEIAAEAVKLPPPELQQQMEQGLVSIQEGMKIVTINKEMFEQKLNDVTTGRFDIIIDHVSQNPTTRREQFNALLNMRQMGIPISDEMIIELSEVRGKQKIIADLQRQRMIMMQQAMLANAPPPGTPMKQNEGMNLAGAQSPMG